ncbi:MAG: hypothetical protein U9O96_01390, partial [Candidatus Thermoplasmatota archaeon]|nr:hypothetical protein [Candidatus Thermoplasmatota archaeon]
LSHLHHLNNLIYIYIYKVIGKPMYYRPLRKNDEYGGGFSKHSVPKKSMMLPILRKYRKEKRFYLKCILNALNICWLFQVPVPNFAASS